MSAARPLPIDVEPKEECTEPMQFPVLEMVGYCRHCGCEITARRFAEYQACSSCSSGIGWTDDSQ